MELKEYRDYHEAEILNLYAAAGWIAYTENPAALRQGFERSLLVLAAYEENHLLGIIRIVGDGATVVFIQDILVYPEHRRKGIGTALLQAVLNRYQHVRQIELVTDNTEETVAFYRSLGFRDLSELGCRSFMKA